MEPIDRLMGQRRRVAPIAQKAKCGFPGVQVAFVNESERRNGPWLYRVCADGNGDLFWFFSIGYEIRYNFDIDRKSPMGTATPLFHVRIDGLHGKNPATLSLTEFTKDDALALVSLTNPGIDDPDIAWDFFCDLFHNHAATEDL